MEGALQRIKRVLEDFYRITVRSAGVSRTVSALTTEGGMIVDGPADPQAIMRLLGIEALAHYIVDEVQDVYRPQA
jgi:hypothetical protein